LTPCGCMIRPRARKFGVLEGHKGHVLGIAFSPVSNSLASCSEDVSTLVWDLSEKK
jgi:WD40 repeat protein